jgi:hypothetical protein
MATSVLPDRPTTEDYLDFGEPQARSRSGDRAGPKIAQPRAGKVGRQTETRCEAPASSRGRCDDALEKGVGSSEQGHQVSSIKQNQTGHNQRKDAKTQRHRGTDLLASSTQDLA